MERFNPFANDPMAAQDDPDPFGTSYNRVKPTVSERQKSSSPLSVAHQPASRSNSFGNRFASNTGYSTNTKTKATNRYSTNFPDPFNEFSVETDATLTKQQSSESEAERSIVSSDRQDGNINNNNNMTSNNNSNSDNRTRCITFGPSSAHSVDESISFGTPTVARSSTASRQASGFSSFLSRATSVTSSSVTEAVGSVRNAVDSLSTQIQQAVPANINERLSTTATSFIGSTTNLPDSALQSQCIQPQQQQQQSAASYLASKITSATGKFTSSGVSSSSMPVISRQRVILVIDSFLSADWAQQFNNYRRLISGTSSGSQSTITSFFTSATAQLTASVNTNLEGDLVEQADFRDVSVLANQATSTATLLINSGNSPTGRASLSAKTSQSSSLANSNVPRIVRPEYVVVRQRTKERSDHLRAIVNALDYCLVPMFEPLEIWNVFQDRQLVFAKLLRVQKQLGRENFPLIPQVYCQTHQDLLNHLNSSSVTLPCLMRTGPFGKGKIKIDNLQMLKDFASIMATSGLGCTVERCLEVKCDLIVQKMGTSLKLFRKIIPQVNESSTNSIGPDERINAFGDNLLRQSSDLQTQQFPRQSASIGSSVLSSFISSNQQITRQGSNPVADAYEKLSDVNFRYRNWIDGITREFGNKLEAFCLKIVVTNDDREYIVGLTNCSLDFSGNQDNQEEDKRSFVELIISNMNTVSSKTHQSADHQLRTNLQSDSMRRISGDSLKKASFSSSIGSPASPMQQPTDSSLGDRKRFISQTQINGSTNETSTRDGQATHRNYGQLSSRSQSVVMNQSDYLIDETPINKSAFFTRRGSDRSDSLGLTEVEDLSISQASQARTADNSSTSNLYQRQASLSQSIFDQTSTALNSFQKQSLNFFKRLDARSSTDFGSNTPPQSAKSDRGFDRTFVSNGSSKSSDSSNTRAGFKSQSIDSSTLERSGSMREGAMHRRTPPKPPPPQSMSFRQSSLVAHSPRGWNTCNTTPNSTPNQTRQNSSVIDTNQSSASDGPSQRSQIVRQNSALSAFEKLESKLASGNNKVDRTTESSLAGGRANQIGSSIVSSVISANKPQRSIDITRKSVNFDSASITSGDSNSTGETATAEDTMNNLKKTFASIFGDKCE